MTPLQRLRLEKAAADCGFEMTPEPIGEAALRLRSAHFPEAVTVAQEDDVTFTLHVSNPQLLDGAASVMLVGYGALYEGLNHTAALARTLPNRVADVFRSQTAALPKTTEVERLVVQRVGQSLFRAALLDFWQGRCCITGLAVPELLRASHIKPWASCDSDDERLDVFNGLLLAPHFDALFDGGWMTFDDDGQTLWSSQLPVEAAGQLGLSGELCVRKLERKHRFYLDFHRRCVWRP